MNTNTKEKFLKDEIFDAFLKEYFIFDCLLDGGFNRKKLLSIVYDYMGFSKENLDELYELLQDKDLTIIKTLSDYNRTNRIIEYNRIYNSYFNSDDVILHLIQIKGNALTELYKNKLDVITSSDSYQELIHLSQKGNVLAMRVSGVMYIEGIYFNKDIKKGLNLLRKTSKWNDINSCFALVKYANVYKDELNKYNLDIESIVSILNTVIDNSLYDGFISEIYDKFNLDKSLLNKKDNDIKLVKRAIASLKLEENKYEKNYSRLLFSKIISNKDKEKILFSEYKALISSACDLPLQLDFKLNKVNNSDLPFNQESVMASTNSAFRKIPLLTSDNYKPMAFVSEANYVLNEYSKYLEKVFNDANIIKINLSGLSLYDLEQNENNIFLRNIDDSKNNVILLTVNGFVDGQVLRLVSKFISSYERKNFNVTNLSLTLDLRNVLPILFVDNQNANSLKESLELIRINKLNENDILLEIDKIIDSKKLEYSIKNVLVSDEFKTLVKDKSIDEVYNIIDITLRDSYGLVDCSLDKDALSKTNTTTNHYGFGGFGYENK